MKSATHVYKNYSKRQINLEFTICRYARSQHSERMCEAFTNIYYKSDRPQKGRFVGIIETLNIKMNGVIYGTEYKKT